MIQITDYKKLIGQTVVCYVPYTTVVGMERTAQVHTVTSVGRSYIHAGGHKFDKETLRCDSPFCALFIGTPQEFSRYIRLKMRIRKQVDRITMALDRMDLSQLEELGAYLDRVDG